MNNAVHFVLAARTPAIGDLVEQCARKQIGFDELCQRISAMGYKTTSLYEMVRVVEWELSQQPAPSAREGNEP